MILLLSCRERFTSERALEIWAHRFSSPFWTFLEPMTAYVPFGHFWKSARRRRYPTLMAALHTFVVKCSVASASSRLQLQPQESPMRERFTLLKTTREFRVMSQHPAPSSSLSEKKKGGNGRNDKSFQPLAEGGETRATLRRKVRGEAACDMDGEGVLLVRKIPCQYR